MANQVPSMKYVVDLSDVLTLATPRAGAPLKGVAKLVSSTPHINRSQPSVINQIHAAKVSDLPLRNDLGSYDHQTRLICRPARRSVTTYSYAHCGVDPAPSPSSSTARSLCIIEMRMDLEKERRSEVERRPRGEALRELQNLPPATIRGVTLGLLVFRSWHVQVYL